jgi:PAS domain S-box-containing protein
MEKLIKILHLEDDINDSDLVQSEFYSAGYKLDYVRVDKEQDFVEQLTIRSFDIILADYSLPSFNGLAALKICNERFSWIPVLIVSGTLGEEIAVKTLKFGASDYLLKHNLQRLIPAVENALKEATLRKEKLLIEQELHASEAKFRSIIENSADAIFIMNKNGKFFFTNKAVTDLLGYKEDEMSMMQLNDLAPNDNYSDLFSSILKQLISEGKVTGEIELLCKNRSHLPVDINAIVLDDGMLYASCRNISERKEADKALLDSERKYRSIFENTQDVYFQIDHNNTIIEVSPIIQKLSGFSRDELIGKTSVDFYFNPQDRDLFIEKLKESGEVWDYEIRMKTKDNTIRYVSLNAHFMLDQDRIPIGIEGSLRDIDERKHFELELEKARDKAQESDKLKTAFLHNISHEIRTPMNAIIGFSSLIGDSEISDEKRILYNRLIKDGSDQLLSIIDDIVDISSIEANILKINVSPVDVDQIVDSLYEQFKLSANNKNIALKVSPGINGKQTILSTDGTRLIQTLSNLINNALKFTIEGQVEFGYTIKGDMMEFFVSDTGIGISQEHQSKVFDNFFQVENDLSTQFGGTGLGLAISKAYIEVLGGKIWLTSELDKGSTFYFCLPYESSQASKQDTIPKMDGSNLFPRMLTILIAEDDDINFNLIEHYLSGSKTNIIRAKNGLEALDVCMHQPGLDLVLMDLKMPEMDGFLATRKINEMKPELPVIAQTAFIDEKEKIFKSGCVDVLIKPFNQQELFQVIRKHTKEYHN